MNIIEEISTLNPRQKEAVEKTEGPLLVLAGAGSGKTKVITMRVANLLSKGINPRHILAVTFTNKAAKEMKSRIKSIMNIQKRAVPVISTFHSVGLNILRQDIENIGYRTNFSVYDTSEQMSLVRSLLSEIKMYDRSVKADKILEMISRKKNGMKSGGNRAHEDEQVEELFERLYPKYQLTLKTLNALDFDDLLLLNIKLFQEHPDVLDKHQKKYRYIMVDEYQDTNLVQYEFIKLLAGRDKNLCVVGDDDQSIYGWRGANPDNILNFQKDFPAQRS